MNTASPTALGTSAAKGGRVRAADSGAVDSPGRVAAAAALIAAAVFAAYSNTFGVPFLFDDQSAVTENPSIRDLSRLGRVFSPETFSVGSRPLLNLTFAANYAWDGGRPWSYHLLNLIGHVLAALTLFGIARRTLPSRGLRSRFSDAALPLSALIGALWALHPLQTEAVTYIAERAESLMGLFYLLTLYLFIRSTASPHPRWWRFWSIAACFCGMATKQVMVTAPAVVMLYDRAYLSASFREVVTRRRWYYLGLGSSWSFLWFLMTGSRFVDRSIGFHSCVGWLTYALAEAKAVATYVKLALWPHPLVFDYGPQMPVHAYQAAPFVLLVMLALVVAALAWRQSKTLGFPAVSFFMLLSPTSSFVPVAGMPVAESRMYLPLATIVTLVALSGYAWGGRKALAVLAVAAVGLGAMTFQRNHDYRSALSIWGDAVAKCPENSRAHDNLGTALAHIPGRLPDAVAQYEEALRLDPYRAEAYDNLGTALAHIPGRLSDAIAQYENALRLKPDSAEAHNNLALTLARIPGRLPDAIIQYEEAMRLKPDAEGLNNLAVLYARTGRISEAISHLERALKLYPDNVDLRSNLEILNGAESVPSGP